MKSLSNFHDLLRCELRGYSVLPYALESITHRAHQLRPRQSTFCWQISKLTSSPDLAGSVLPYRFPPINTPRPLKLRENSSTIPPDFLRFSCPESCLVCDDWSLLVLLEWGYVGASMRQQYVSCWNKVSRTILISWRDLHAADVYSGPMGQCSPLTSRNVNSAEYAPVSDFQSRKSEPLHWWLIECYEYLYLDSWLFL